MDDGLKKRLIGAAVLASLAVIFVPMLFEEPPADPPPLPPLPSKPPASDFASEMLREEIPAITPLVPPASSAETETAVPEPPPVSEKPRTGLSAWVVQAASLSNEEAATALVTKLRDAGLPTPPPELVDIRGKRWYRVKVGPVIDRAKADAMVDQVSEIAGTKAQVRQYP
ncbi:MAG: SPOR domain-containing protein [Gammaproteobacteria bacterium]|nr:SPOR domain-containing protein [Gammaproteobacteria bacterium]